jgi:septum formation protein
LQEAKRMLGRLVGKSHEVITAVALVRASSGQMTCRMDRTRVKFRTLSDSQIEAYMRIAGPLDKAGAYSAQTRPEMIIEEFTGSFSNIVGLPMEVVGPLLASHGIYPGVMS